MWTINDIDTNKKPVYLTVLEALENDIRSGKLNPGERVPTHRNLAEMLGVTLGTASRIYKKAVQQGLITAVVGRGTFVTADAGRQSFIDLDRATYTWDLAMVNPLACEDPPLGAIIRKVIHKHRQPHLMSYDDPQGLPEHRGIGADWIARYGPTTPPKNIVVTAGGQHAIFVICNSLFQRGDRMAVDCLTYPGIKTAAQRNGVLLEGVAMDECGMLPDALDALCNRTRIKAVYVCGRLQYPTVRVMTAQRQRELAAIIRKHGLQLIEDDVYGFLSDSSEKSLSALMPEEAIYISSLSKAFLAGLRMAYVSAPAHLVMTLVKGVADSMICASPLNADIASECIRSGMADTTIRHKKDSVAKRLRIFSKIFVNHQYTASESFMSIWLALPRSWTVADLEAEARKRKIRLFTSERFAVGSMPPPRAVPVSLTGVESLTALRRGLLSLERLISKPADSKEDAYGNFP